MLPGTVSHHPTKVTKNHDITSRKMQPKRYTTDLGRAYITRHLAHICARQPYRQSCDFWSDEHRAATALVLPDISLAIQVDDPDRYETNTQAEPSKFIFYVIKLSIA